jgi:gliding motility-associated-like protein
VLIGANAKPGLVYSWSPPTGLNNPSISNPLASPDVTTKYVLTTRHNGGGCADTDTVLVKAAVIDSSLLVLGKTLYCFGSGDSTILRVQPADSIQWFKDDVAIYGANQTQYRVTKSGVYHALLFNKTGGCSIATKEQDVVIDIAKPGVNYPIQYAVVDLPIKLQARQFGATALWSPANNLDNPASYSPSFQGLYDQLYTVEIKTNSGCVTVDTQLVKIVPHVDMYVPTAFTPNNDGLNDFLRPTLMGIKELHYFKIYNRWGQLLFESKTERPGWNGNFNGINQPTQVVVWIAEGLGVDGRNYTRKGTTTLVR